VLDQVAEIVGRQVGFFGKIGHGRDAGNAFCFAEIVFQGGVEIVDNGIVHAGSGVELAVVEYLCVGQDERDVRYDDVFGILVFPEFVVGFLVQIPQDGFFFLCEKKGFVVVVMDKVIVFGEFVDVAGAHKDVVTGIGGVDVPMQGILRAVDIHKGFRLIFEKLCGFEFAF